jgi:predicted nucleic acid-binding Zn ribbon protein
MPLYDYKCPACEEIEEFTFPIGKAPSEIGRHSFECNVPMKRIINPVTVSFKGAGFYKTDNREVNVQGQ